MRCTWHSTVFQSKENGFTICRYVTKEPNLPAVARSKFSTPGRTVITAKGYNLPTTDAVDFESMVGCVGWWYLAAFVSVCGRRKGLDLCGFTGWNGLETWTMGNSPIEQVFGMFVSWRLAGDEATYYSNHQKNRQELTGVV